MKKILMILPFLFNVALAHNYATLNELLNKSVITDNNGVKSVELPADYYDNLADAKKNNDNYAEKISFLNTILQAELTDNAATSELYKSHRNQHFTEDPINSDPIALDTLKGNGIFLKDKSGKIESKKAVHTIAYFPNYNNTVFLENIFQNINDIAYYPQGKNNVISENIYAISLQKPVDVYTYKNIKINYYDESNLLLDTGAALGTIRATSYSRLNKTENYLGTKDTMFEVLYKQKTHKVLAVAEVDSVGVDQLNRATIILDNSAPKRIITEGMGIFSSQAHKKLNP